MSRIKVPDMAFDVSSSDDDAPEEISVAKSRLQGISQIKDIQESLRRSKEEEREKRRQRNEMFRIQKENRLKDLSKRKLPDDVLAAVSAKAAKNLLPQEESPPLNKAVGRSDDDNDEEVEKTSEHGDDNLSDSGVDDVSDVYKDVEEFIPIGNKSGLALVTPGALAKKRQTAADKALSFKHNRLYSLRGIPRESTKQRRSRVAKRRANRGND